MAAYDDGGVINLADDDDEEDAVCLSAAQLDVIEALFGPADCDDSQARRILEDAVQEETSFVSFERDDDDLEMVSYSAKDLAKKRLEDALKRGAVVDLVDSDDDEEPKPLPFSEPKHPPPKEGAWLSSWGDEPEPTRHGLSNSFSNFMCHSKLELKDMCRRRGLKVSGNKTALSQRLAFDVNWGKGPAACVNDDSLSCKRPRLTPPSLP